MEVETLQAEANFADGEYSPQSSSLAISQRMFRKYAEPQHWWDWRQFAAHLLGNVAGKSLLDYGCGMGEEAVYFAKLGARVTAIDASEVGINITRERAAYNDLADRLDARVMDATASSFSDNSFDLVHGLGILHHVALGPGLREVRRLLKPGGTAVFLEPMGNVRWVERCKCWLHGKLQGRLGLIRVTEDEDNLKLKDVLACASQFSQFQAYPYRLLYRVRRLTCPRAFHPLLARIDYQLLKAAPALRVFAGAVVIHLKK